MVWRRARYSELTAHNDHAESHTTTRIPIPTNALARTRAGDRYASRARAGWLALHTDLMPLGTRTTTPGQASWVVVTSEAKPVVAWHDRRWLRVVGAVVLTVLVIALAGTVLYRAHYHEWPLQSIPSEFSYCGHTYQRGGDISPEVAKRSGPLFHELWLDAPLSSSREVLSAHPGTCDPSLFIRDGRHFIDYDSDASG